MFKYLQIQKTASYAILYLKNEPVNALSLPVWQELFSALTSFGSFLLFMVGLVWKRTRKYGA